MLTWTKLIGFLSSFQSSMTQAVPFVFTLIAMCNGSLNLTVAATSKTLFSSFNNRFLFFFFFCIYLNFTICPIGHLVKYYSLENKNTACGWLPPAGLHIPGCLLYFYYEVCGMLLLQSSFYYGFIRLSNQLVWVCYKSFFILFCISGDFFFYCWNF